MPKLRYKIPFFKLFGILSLVLLISLATFYTVYAADTTPPVTTYVQTPSSPDGNDGWYVSTVQFVLSATDLASGVKAIYYRIDGGAWQSESFTNTQNFAPNPSFETAGATSSGLAGWEATIIDPEGTYDQDPTSAPAFPNNSAVVDATGGTWHGINHKDQYAPTTPFDNMSAGVWMKTQDVTGSAYYKIYAVSEDGSGGYIYQQIATSSGLTGSNGWTLITTDFIVNVSDAIGVYIDIGLAGPGTVWADGVTLNSSAGTTETTVTIATDSANHTLEYYAVDNDNNVETYSCASPIKNCITFKLDQTPPGNWHDSGAVRGGTGSQAEHELFVFTIVEDQTSGLSTETDQYQYHIPGQSDFGYYTDLIYCNTPWIDGGWRDLQDTVTVDGEPIVQLKTPKTDFCDSNWKSCKTVRFYAEDVAGNITTKDICLNGPWIKIVGGGIVRSDAYIDMISEPNEDNTDGLIEVGQNTIDFFTSSTGWRVFESTVPDNTTYAEIYNMVDGNKTDITGGDLVVTSGIYTIIGDYQIDTQSRPNNYDSAIFDQIVFVDGNLTVSVDTVVGSESAALFVVSGDVQIEKSVDAVGFAIIADGDIYTAYDAAEGDTMRTLNLNGIFVADEIKLQRTLQGTQNNDTPSESFVFEPKYLIQLKPYFNTSATTWRYLQ